MEAMESSPGVVTFAGPKDRAPKGALVSKIEIDCRVPGQTMTGGHLLKEGVQWVTVYSHDLPRIYETMVWDENPEDEDPRFPTEQSKIEEAYERLHEELVESLREVSGSSEGKMQFFKHFQKVLKTPEKDLKEQDLVLLREWRQLQRVTPLSMESTFSKRWGRCIKPLRSLKVLQPDIPLPEESRDLVKDKAIMAALIQELRSGETKAPDDMMAKFEALMKANAELQARVEELEEAQTKPKKKT